MREICGLYNLVSHTPGERKDLAKMPRAMVDQGPIPPLGPVIEWEKAAPQFFCATDQRPGVTAIG